MANAMQIVVLLSIFCVCALGKVHHEGRFHFWGNTKGGQTWNPPVQEGNKCTPTSLNSYFEKFEFKTNHDNVVVINCTLPKGFKNHFKLYIYKDNFDANSPCENLQDTLVDNDSPSKRNLVISYPLLKGKYIFVVTADQNKTGKFDIWITKNGDINSSSKQYYPIILYDKNTCITSPVASPYGFKVWTHLNNTGSNDFQVTFRTDEPWHSYMVIYLGEILNWPTGTLDPCNPPDRVSIIIVDNTFTNTITLKDVHQEYHQYYTSVFSGIGADAYAHWSWKYSPTIIGSDNNDEKILPLISENYADEL